MVCWPAVWLNLPTSTKQPWSMQSRKWSCLLMILIPVLTLRSRYVTQSWPLDRGSDLASEPLGRHNLSDAGEVVVDNYESVSSNGNEVKNAVVELHESKIESNGGVRILLVYVWLMVYWHAVWLNLPTSTKQPWSMHKLRIWVALQIKNANLGIKN